jgi:glycosyltransferase involved in cell wall biosynthesis
VTEVFGPEAADLTSARAVVRHPGLPPSWFVPAPADEQAAFRARHGIAADATVVSSYVRLVPEKGVAMLLDVAERLAVQRPGTVLVVGGDGRLEQELHRRGARAASTASARWGTSTSTTPRCCAHVGPRAVPSRPTPA